MGDLIILSPGLDIVIEDGAKLVETSADMIMLMRLIAMVGDDEALES